MVVVVGAPGPETETQSFRFRVLGFWVSGFGCAQAVGASVGPVVVVVLVVVEVRAFA